jgi:succinyl-diaminopimelate desuccinylase|tara:strand:+ start:159 stop:1298 length:1140 start_codon:yes stop_codon:yes gene_type:complete
MTDLIKSPEIDLLCELVKRESVTPDDAGCQGLLIERLQAMGFECETLQFGDVTNLWARRGTTAPVLCFAGHTDVVPPGDSTQWSSNPFQPTVKDGVMYGRGTADMKSGLASIIVAIENFLQVNAKHKGSIALLITSDEEGRARDGTLKVMETLSKRGESIDWCVIGEPSSQDALGDLIRIGRRGSLSGMLKVMGTQGHVAYPHLADNPIRRFAPVLSELHNIEWDQGNEHFPPSSFQVVDIKSGVGAPNVTPAELSARFNFRYSTVWNHESLKKRVHEVFDAHDIDYELNWHLSGEPFLTKPGRLIDAAVQAVTESTGKEPLLSTGGGTSDGRFISPTGVDVVELGPVNASIHKIDEHVRIADVIQLTGIYTRILQLLL